MQTNIYLVRHGQAECNLYGFITGGGGRKNESPLTETGGRQAAELRDKFKGIHFADVLSSDLCRAVETADIIANGKLPVNKQTALRERDFGELEGKPEATLKPYLSAQEHMTPEEIWNTPIRQDVESDAHIYKRVLPCITQAAKKHTGKNVLVVAHGGPIRTLLIGQGIASEDNLPIESLEHGSFVHLQWTGDKFTLVSSTGVDKHNYATE